ncbi:MAG: hypothetical protein NC483_01075 [Ruminococcus sp.]|nr:hypothetical protein [Ruminococcus sp.]
MKKYLIISLCVIISILASLSYSSDIFLTDSKSLIETLLTLLGLCFTSFSFISASINDILKKSNKNTDEALRIRLDKLLDSIQKDILLIFYATIVLIIINIFCYFDFPLLNNPRNLDFGLFVIPSLKQFSLNFLVSFIFCLSLYSLYDLIKASFILLRKCY